MEAEVKEVIKEKEYVHGDHDYYDYDRDRDRFASKGVAGAGLGLGIAGTALGLWALSRRGGLTR